MHSWLHRISRLLLHAVLCAYSVKLNLNFYTWQAVFHFYVCVCAHEALHSSL